MITVGTLRKAIEGLPDDAVMAIDSRDGKPVLVFCRPLAVMHGLTAMPQPKVLCLTKDDINDLVDIFTSEPVR